MISGVKKIPILRYGLIVLLIVVLFASAFYLYLHYNKAEKLRNNFQLMVNARENSTLIDSCIVELYSADNYSRMYALTAKKWYFNEFSRHIKNVHGVIVTINANNKQSAILAQNDELNDLVIQKSIKTDSYIKLMSLSDSLLRSARKMNRSLRDANNKLIKQPVVKRIKTAIKIDTIKVVAKAPEPKKKFFGRVFSVFSKKKKPEAAPPLLVEKRTDTVITTMKATPQVAQAYNKYYSKLYEANNKLRANEREMLEINNRMVNQIIGSLKKYKIAEQQYINGSKNELTINLGTVLDEFRRLSGIIFLFLTVIVAVILYNIWKIFRNEEELVVHTEMAENYALAKSRFLASMSHEIRTPLNSIIGFSEQLSKGDLHGEQPEQVNAITTSSKMLLDVVNEILDFSKYETGKMNFEVEPMSPYNAVEEIAISMQVQATKKGISLTHQIDFGKDVCLKGDYFRLKQVIMNLVGNAIKFTPQGQVGIKAFLTDGKDGRCVLNVQVKDTGLGIDKDHLPMIFDEFSQVTSAQKVANHGGTGLGLAISKKIIELQGGKMTVTSTLGKGSVFSFSLPMQTGTLQECTQKSGFNTTDAQVQLQGRHVLLAEDNKLNVLLVSTILKKHKLTFDVAYNGREALQLFEDNSYDIILTDIEMPEMGGIELSQLVRTNHSPAKSEVPILALTANVLKEDRDRYLSVGMNGVVLKPFSEKNLVDNIAEALNGNTVFSA